MSTLFHFKEAKPYALLPYRLANFGTGRSLRLQQISANIAKILTVCSRLQQTLGNPVTPGSVCITALCRTTPAVSDRNCG
jgi:hypothetical protein